MLQIKKNATLVSCKYNLLFLFRKRYYTDYNLVKTKTQSIFLRSPKHFNIGKQKILNLNYKTPTLFFNKKYSFFFNGKWYEDILYKILCTRIKLTPTIKVSSLRVTLKTKFKLMWLEL